MGIKQFSVCSAATRVVKIAGQIGRAPDQRRVESDDFGTQWRIAMENLVAVLRAAGGEPQHLVMLRAYVTEMAEFNAAGAAVGAAWGATLGRHFPAMTLVQVQALIDPAAKVEIDRKSQTFLDHGPAIDQRALFMQRLQLGIGQDRLTCAKADLVQPHSRPHEDGKGAGADLGI